MKHIYFLILILSLCFSLFIVAQENESKTAPDTKQQAHHVSLVNLNTADAKELATLPGIGESRAMRIISYREQKGKIASLTELNQISGFGERSIAKLKGRVTF